MRRLKRLFTLKGIGALLSLLLSVPLAIPPAHLAIAIGGTVLLQTQTACGPSDLSKLHDILNKTAKTLDTAIDTNGKLYEQGFYGKVGSVEAVAKLHKGAQIIKDAALHLKTALTLAQALTKETFEAGKLAVLDALSKSMASMPATGAQTLDLVLQGVATLISQAVAIVQLFQSSDLPSIRRIQPELKDHIRQFERITEVSV
ncbi:MAG TPA: hypothetical protein VF290_18135 [Pyrinomonadaceae bacterium]